TDLFDRAEPDPIGWVLQILAQPRESLDIGGLISTRAHLVAHKDHPAASLRSIFHQLLHLIKVQIVEWSSHCLRKIDKRRIVGSLIQVSPARKKTFSHQGNITLC